MRPAPPQARKRFGQHFLEPVWVDKVMRAIAPAAADVFLEIGPGRGALTRPLAAAAGHVIALEIDRDLAAALRASDLPNLTVLEGDVLQTTGAVVEQAVAAAGAEVRRLRVAGNLPYNVASPILFKLVDLFDAGLPLVDATVMLQREVADRVLAKVGTGDYGTLGILTRWRAEVRRLLDLPPGAFRPPPKVRSTLIHLTFHRPVPAVADPAAFAGLTQALFTRRRKMLANALLAYPPARLATPGAVLARAGIDGRRRPETLGLDELARLADALS